MVYEENEYLMRLMELEDLAEKKTKIYSRLLIEAALAEKMEALSACHKRRKEAIEKLLYGEVKNGKRKTQDGSMSEMKAKEQAK